QVRGNRMNRERIWTDPPAQPRTVIAGAEIGEPYFDVLLFAREFIFFSVGLPALGTVVGLKAAVGLIGGPFDHLAGIFLQDKSVGTEVIPQVEIDVLAGGAGLGQLAACVHKNTRHSTEEPHFVFRPGDVVAGGGAVWCPANSQSVEDVKRVLLG